MVIGMVSEYVYVLISLLNITLCQEHNYKERNIYFSQHSGGNLQMAASHEQGYVQIGVGQTVRFSFNVQKTKLKKARVMKVMLVSYKNGAKA